MEGEKDTKAIEDLNKHGRSVFGSRIAFDAWLDAENLALGGKKPSFYLTYEDGIQLVDDVLTAIEYGNLA